MYNTVKWKPTRILDGIRLNELKEERGDHFTPDEEARIDVFIRGYLGEDLVSSLDTLLNLYPLIHPYALEWNATLDDWHSPGHDGYYYLVSVDAEDFNAISNEIV